MVRSNLLPPDSAWIKRACFATRKRVEMPWTKSRRLDFDHSITTLRHPFIHTPPEKEYDKILDKRTAQQLLFLNQFPTEFSLKKLT